MRCDKCHGLMLTEYDETRCVNCGWRGWPRNPTLPDLQAPERAKKRRQLAIELAIEMPK